MNFIGVGYALSLPTSMAGMEIFSSLIIFAAGVILFREKSGRELFQLKTTWAALALWIWTSVTTLFIPELEVGQKFAIVGEGRWSLVLLGLIVFLRDRQRALFVLKTTLALAALVAIYSVVQTFTGFDFKGRIFQDSAMVSGGLKIFRARGFFSNSMTYGQATQFLFYASLAFLLISKAKWRWLLTLLIGLGMTLSFTRGVWLAAAVSGLMMAALVNRKALVSGLIALGVVAGAAYVGSPAVQARVHSAFDPQDSGSQERVALWRANWNMFLAHPVTGVGLGQGAKRVREFHDRSQGELTFVSHAHNIFIEYLSTTGGPGLFLFLVFLTAILMDWLKVRSSLDSFEQTCSLALVGSVLGLILSGMTEANFIDGEVNHAFLFIVGLTLAPLALKSKSNGSA